MIKKNVFFIIFTILIFSLHFDLIFAEEQEESIGIIIISTDKITYSPEEAITISGEVTERKMPLIAISIFDPDDKILGGYNVELDDNNQFSKIIMADIPFYEKPGIYTITAEYGKIESETIFEIENYLFLEEIDAETIEPETKPRIVLFETDKETYQDNDVISITGKVSEMSHPQVTITIFDPYNVPTGIYLSNVNPDLTFSTSFLAKYNTNFKVIGSYSIAAQYGEAETRQSRTIQFIEKIIVAEVTETSPTHSFLFTESDLEHLASWHYLDGTDVELASFFEDLVKRDLIDLDTSTTLSKKLLSDWIKINNSSLGSMINDLFEGKISEEEFVLLVEDSLNNHTKDPSIDIVDEVSPVPKTKPISEIKKSKNIDSKKSENISSEVKNELKIEPDEEKMTYFYSNVNCEKNSYEDVISQYNNPGPALARLCKYEDAISHYEKTLEQDPKNVYALTNIGSALANLGRYGEAVSYYDKALEIDPKHLAALNNKGNALTNLGYYQDAVSYYDKALKIDSQYLPTLGNKEKASILLASFPTTESQMHPVSDQNLEFNEHEQPAEKDRSKDLVAQFANALSSIGNSLLSLFGG